MLKIPLIDISFIEAEIQDQYLADDNKRPWIIGFSGGKDSTMLLQLVWNALRKLDPAVAHLERDVWVVCNDTLVENPRIARFVEGTLKKIELAAVEQGIPFKVQRTSPPLEDTFWVKLIGRGYPAPSNTFRWCTERLKINPTTRFIKSQISERGEVIILLGTRSAESQRRANSIKKHAVRGQRLRKHVLPNAFVYAPIKDVETNEVWQYLSQVPPPWGGTNHELRTLYLNASSGDCPLVIDTTTPSCGQSRFGCWVCTVVKRDRSMEGLIENGEDWMEPLVELRDDLAENRNRRELRERFRRQDRLSGTEDDETWGPYIPAYRAQVLEKLLRAQHDIQASQGDWMQLISHQELVAIQVIWYRDGIFSPTVSEIYNRVYQTTIDMSRNVEKKREEEELLREVCRDNPDHVELIQKGLKLLKTKSLMMKKRGLGHDIETSLEEYLVKKNIVAYA